MVVQRLLALAMLEWVALDFAERLVYFESMNVLESSFDLLEHRIQRDHPTHPHHSQHSEID
jgi:hypothetical protein